MVYIPSIEILSKMILACSKSIGGGSVEDEFDILERFISTKKMAKNSTLQ